MLLRALVLGSLLLAALTACESRHYETPARSLSDCFFEPWRPNC
jgi:hypothetical protein